jgi:biopolymer transport protein ExbD
LKRREHLTPDLTPLIDILFLLLIFFLATSVFKKSDFALNLTLPSAKYASKVKSEVKSVEILISTLLD